MTIKKTIAALALWAALGSPSSAQTVVEDPSGFRTQVPAQYTIRQDPSGVLASNAAQTAAIVMKAHRYSSFEAFAADSDLGRDGFSLVGEPQALAGGGGYFRASKPRPEGGYIIADTFVTFSPNGGGCLVVSLAEQDHADAAYYHAHEIVSKLEFIRPQASAASVAWDNALRGKHLVYLYTGNGYSERFDLYLGANGTFAQRSDMSSASLNGTGWANGRADGVWQITAAGQLVLSYHDGRAKTYSLAPRQASNEVSLNGQRYFVIPQ
jgi:hypothetical protein